MFKKEARKESLFFLLNGSLKIMKWALEKYEKTSDEVYLSYVKHWDEMKKYYEQEIKNT